MPSAIKIKSNLPNDYVKIVKYQKIKAPSVQFKNDFAKKSKFAKVKIMKIYF